MVVRKSFDDQNVHHVQLILACGKVLTVFGTVFTTSLPSRTKEKKLEDISDRRNLSIRLHAS